MLRHQELELGVNEAWPWNEWTLKIICSMSPTVVMAVLLQVKLSFPAPAAPYLKESCRLNFSNQKVTCIHSTAGLVLLLCARVFPSAGASRHVHTVDRNLEVFLVSWTVRDVQSGRKKGQSQTSSRQTRDVSCRHFASCTRFRDFMYSICAVWLQVAHWIPKFLQPWGSSRKGGCVSSRGLCHKELAWLCCFFLLVMAGQDSHAQRCRERWQRQDLLANVICTYLGTLWSWMLSQEAVRRPDIMALRHARYFQGQVSTWALYHLSPALTGASPRGDPRTELAKATLRIVSELTHWPLENLKMLFDLQQTFF